MAESFRTPSVHDGRADARRLRPAEEAPGGEVGLLRRQVMDLRATVAEQEETISFLRDLLAQRWFDAAG